MSAGSEIASVECLLGSGQDLYHLAWLHTGLMGLEKQGHIHLRFRSPSPAERAYSDDGHTMLLVSRECRTRRIGIDLYDRNNRWEESLLTASDVYFKRSYCLAEAAKRPEAARIFPLGLNYAARCDFSPWRPARALGVRLVSNLLSGALPWRRALDRFRQFADSPVASAFERPPAVAADGILFQPRLWEPESTDDNVEEVNGLRVGIVRLLAQEFGSRFSGGVLPTPYARSRYPDALSKAPSARPEYVRFSLRHAIGINTRGLHHSNPFKIGEYLAGSFCLLSDPMRNELPEPLRQGIEYDLYTTPEECAAHCERLLSNPGEIQERREASWRYYRDNVRAEALWAKRLAEALAI